MDALGKLYSRYRTIRHLEDVQELLDWDQQVMMPKAGVHQRAEQMAALAQQIHLALADPVLGDLLEETAARTDLSSAARADMRVLRRRHRRATRIPTELMVRHARLSAVAQARWESALSEKNFALFRHALSEMISTTRDIGLAVDSEAPYDALIEEYEPGMDSVRIEEMFTGLNQALLDLIESHRAVAQAPPPWDFGNASFPAKTQKRIATEILEEMGLDFSALRFDASTHPCTSGTGRDVRITTRYRLRNPLTGILSAIHEGGHALYEQGLPGEKLSTPSGCFCSFGIHESQSLFWENIIGRSRPFLDRLLSRFSGAFSGAFDAVDSRRFFWTVNRVRASAIRIEADELTYCLHIIIRFELERALFSGDLTVEDLPEAWNNLYRERLGIRPRHDGEGVLQDIHWAAGLFGYFPSYALGYIYAAQFNAALQREQPDIEERIASGDLKVVAQWFTERVHKWGRRLLPEELIQEVTGSPPSVDPLLRYWRLKYLTNS